VLETGESKTLGTSYSLCSFFLGAKSFSDNLTLGAELKEADLALVRDDPWLISGTLAFQWANETAEWRPVDQGVVYGGEKRILVYAV